MRSLHLQMNYYNEFDPKTAAWLRELIKAGAIPDGHVDERSIVDVQPGDLKGYTQCHFFAGIGGWSYALQLAGWPSDRPVWSGSCPCQPFSVAGKGLGTEDERHLWPVFAELIRQCQPPTVFGEQVASKAGRNWLAGVFADLEAMEYSRAGADLCAAGVGAPHIRQRLWWVANSKRGVWKNGEGSRSRLTGGMGWGVQHVPWDRPWQCALSELRALNDGLSRGSMEVCGGARNAIVPQVAAEFIAAFIETQLE
jgi:DNA (cytosine-5)-methyltransferase 1